MRKIADFFLCFILLILAAWQIPWVINFIRTPDTSQVYFAIYSAAADDFICNQLDENLKLQRVGTDGRVYSEAEADSLLPCFFMRQLVADGRFPDSIQGVAVTPHGVQQTNLTIRLNPRDINGNLIELYPLMESMPKRVDLEMPDDVFRITSEGIEFIAVETNQIKEQKSRMFTEALQAKGFRFPALWVSGNPSTRKNYDEGYLLLDSNHRLFNLKRCAGHPFVHEFAIPEGITLTHAFAIEPNARQFRGLATDTGNRLYVLTTDYRLVLTGVESFQPTTDRILIIGNMFDWTVAVTDDYAIHHYAIDASDYHLIRRLDRTFEEAADLPGLHFPSADDKFCYPRF
jgi:hypothetical protein